MVKKDNIGNVIAKIWSTPPEKTTKPTKQNTNPLMILVFQI